MSGGVVVLINPAGERVEVHLTDHDMSFQPAFRAAFRRQVGWAPQRLRDDEFADVVEALNRLADAVEPEVV